MDELSEISVAMRDLLREKTDSAQATYDLWFGELNITALTEDTATLSTPSKLRKNILSTRFKKVITECIAEIIGFEVKIEIYSLDEQEEEKKTVTNEGKEDVVNTLHPLCNGCPYGRAHEFCFPCLKYILGQGGYH